MLFSLLPWLVGEAVQEASMKATSTRSSVQRFVVGMLTSFSKGHPTLPKSPISVVERILPTCRCWKYRGGVVKAKYRRNTVPRRL